MVLITALLIDLDGTMYHGKSPIPGAKAFINFLEEHKIPFLFVTNNATRSHAEAQHFLAKYHDIVVDDNHFYSSADALISRLQLSDSQESAFVIGKSAIKHSVEGLGYRLENTNEQAVDVVIVSLDQEVSYQELSFACLAIQNGASFYLTNPDIQFPSENGFVPGAGAIAQVIADVTEQSPIVCGKPEPTIIEGAIDKLGVPSSDVIVLGDNLLTDIQAGLNADVYSVLIETGVHHQSDIEMLGVTPDAIVKNHQEFIERFLIEE